MEETIELEGGYTVEIIHDEHAQDPRKDFDHVVGTMACWHRNYTLGDEQPSGDPEDYMLDLLPVYVQERIERWVDREENRAIEGESSEAWWQRVADGKRTMINAELEKVEIVLPLYLYDHGGITMSTSGFSCPWDSGQVGIIHCSRAKAVEEWGKKNCTAKVVAAAERYLVCEVEEYDQYITGDVWGYVVKDPHGDELDSCWGFYGSEYAKQEARNAGESEIASAKLQRAETLKAMIRSRTPLHVRQAHMEQWDNA